MVRISGVDLPPNKRIEVGLTYIYGIGAAMSRQILEKSGVDGDKKGKDLSDPEVVALRDAIKQRHPHVEVELALMDLDGEVEEIA